MVPLITKHRLRNEIFFASLLRVLSERSRSKKGEQIASWLSQLPRSESKCSFRSPLLCPHLQDPVPHTSDLVVSFIYILLIDAQSTNPMIAKSCFATEEYEEVLVERMLICIQVNDRLESDSRLPSDATRQSSREHYCIEVSECTVEMRSGIRDFRSFVTKEAEEQICLEERKVLTFF